MKFLITNKQGCFALLGPVDSRYDGVFFWLNNKMFRSVVFFDVPGTVKTSVNDIWRVRRSRDSIVESFWWSGNAFFYDLSKKACFDIVLDVKENYDNREWGRFYELVEENDFVFVRFQKRNDIHEKCGDEFELWLAFYRPGLSFAKIDKWEVQSCPFDKSRDSPPFERYVYRAGTLNSDGCVVSCAATKESAARQAKSAFKNRAKLEKAAQNDVLPFYNEAVQFAANSLLSLKADDCLFAGLPWFHQRWLRDEAISCKALMLLDEYKLAKDVLFYWLEHLRDDGTFPGTLSHTIADGAWVFVRIMDYLEKHKLTAKEMSIVKQKLELFLRRLNVVHGVVFNGAGETWMDTDQRSGARIEINALALAACRLAEKLGVDCEQEKLKDKVVASFWEKDHLVDGVGDDTVRPNVFIAAYLYPELLSKQKWIKCFDYCLNRLWLAWGGIATLDKRSKCFHNEHTGENPVSYHKGDSWYWINNLVALVLHRFDKKKYEKLVKKIVIASRKEILTRGAQGHHAELSSAKARSSHGCLAQAWSDAMFIELMAELKEFS